MTLPSSRLHAGFTLVELMIATVAAGLLLAGVFVMSNTVSILAAKNFAINNTGTEARNTLDLIQSTVQQAYDNPIPIDDQGAVIPTLTPPIKGATITSTPGAVSFVPVAYAVTDDVSLTSGVLSGGTQYIPAKGIKFNRVLGGPYIINVPSSSINLTPGTTTSLSFTIDAGAQIPPPLPSKGDIISIYTTAIMGAPSTLTSDNTARVQVTGSTATLVSSVNSTTTSGTLCTYSVAVSGTFVNTNNATLTSGYIAYRQGLQLTTPSAVLLRPTAYVIVNAATTTQLRYIDSYTLSGNNVNVNNYTRVMTYDIQPFSDANPRPSWSDQNPSGFAIIDLRSKIFVSVVLHIHAQSIDKFLNYAGRQRTDFCTFMGIGTMISLKGNPNMQEL